MVIVLTELEKMKHAKYYIDMLANGIDPLTGMEFESDTILNNVRLSRCFFYVSEVLGRVIENGGEVISRRAPATTEPVFAITPEAKQLIEISTSPVSATVLAKNISACRVEGTKALSVIKITGWLLENGYLTEEVRGEKRNRVASQRGMSIGISTVDGVSMQGVPYRKNLYDSRAQRFVVDHLDEISQ